VTIESRGLSDAPLALRMCAGTQLWVLESFQLETLVDDFLWGTCVFGLTPRETSRGKWRETKTRHKFSHAYRQSTASQPPCDGP
jgi:hypothetical protein